jgi:hypothetical protein
MFRHATLDGTRISIALAGQLPGTGRNVPLREVSLAATPCAGLCWWPETLSCTAVADRFEVIDMNARIYKKRVRR